ncbi:Cell Wall Hydrolase [Desulfosporosinus acidiphilus SJ4]|uniref:Cell Wall Hydrolase n=1 Tax=Desulfosporosinus acidiphilus (strain DSM 22704 / JCM 16185 / SJ4) TaxID=646529 RepID=I4DBR4_DESAJ|nr:Cell Wall Hydrolase [Desulfosporosinus acidiphilus SJ4]
MPHRRCRKSWAIFLCGMMCLFLWQASIYPVLGQDNVYEIMFANSNTSPNPSRSQKPQPTKSTTKIPTYNIIVNNDQNLTNKASQEMPPPEAVTGHQVLSRSLGRLVSEEEVDLLSRVIYGEARGENFEGQVAVGAVVLNRLKDPHFPKTIWGVVYQPGAFTAVKDQQIHLDPNDEAYKAAEAALSGDDPTNGAIYYYNPRLATDRWIKSRPVIKRIGNHTFSI